MDLLHLVHPFISWWTCGFSRDPLMAKINKTDNIKRWHGCGATGTLVHYGWEPVMVPRLRESLASLIKINIHLLHTWASQLVGISSRTMQMYVKTKTCRIFHNSKNGKPPSYPSIGERTNKLSYFPKMESYPTSHKRWMRVENITLSERARIKGYVLCNYYGIPFFWWISRTHNTYLCE